MNFTTKLVGIIILTVSLSAIADSNNDIILAIWDDGQINKGQLLQRLETINEPYPGIVGDKSTPMFKKKILKQLAAEKIISNQLRTDGVNLQKDFRELMKPIEDSILIEALDRQEVIEPIKVTDEEIKSYFETFPNEIPESCTFEYLFFDTSQAVDKNEIHEIQEAAENIVQGLNNGGEMGTIVEAFKPFLSDRVKHGTTTNALLSDVSMEIQDAIKIMKPGQYSNLIILRSGFEIVKLLGYKENSRQPLEELKEEIKETIRKDKEYNRRNELKSALEKGSVIKRNYDLFEYAPRPDKDVVLMIDNIILTLDELNTKYIPEDPLYQMYYNAVDFKKKTCEKIIEQELLVKKAREFGLTSNQKVLSKIAEAEQKKLFDYWLDKEIDKKINALPERNIREFYKTNKYAYKSAPKATLIIAYFPANLNQELDEAQKESAFREAEERAKEQLRKVNDKLISFEEMAEQYSATGEGLSKYDNIQQGILGYHIDNEIWTMLPNQISAPIRIPTGYAILKLIDRTQSAQLSFEEATQRVKIRYKKEFYDDFRWQIIETLLKQYNFNIQNEDKI